MPQKKNPDALELLRGKSGRTVGQLTGFLTTLKGLPATYNKDLQESQEPMFDAAETIGKSLRILQGVISTLKVRTPCLPDHDYASGKLTRPSDGVGLP
jgi:argininosuccinate lyase